MKNKIIAWLQEELESSRQIIAEYTDENRPKCDDGSDDFIEGNYNTCLLYTSPSPRDGLL